MSIMYPASDLRTTRIRKGLRIEDLASGMLRPATISEVERGLRLPHTRTKRRIESVLGPIDWKKTLTSGDRGHLVYAVTELVNEPDGGDVRGRIRFIRQILRMIEETLST